MEERENIRDVKSPLYRNARPDVAEMEARQVRSHVLSAEATSHPLCGSDNSDR